MVARPTAGEAALVAAVRWGEASRRAVVGQADGAPLAVPRTRPPSARWEPARGRETRDERRAET
ncbi:MAG: hypothetical protein IKO72_13110 [Kiritimatiellae bacterium]|nr:hypothetical protein [Kiritimatiellia bacterium]